MAINLDLPRRSAFRTDFEETKPGHYVNAHAFAHLSATRRLSRSAANDPPLAAAPPEPSAPLQTLQAIDVQRAREPERRSGASGMACAALMRLAFGAALAVSALGVASWLVG